MSYLLKVTQRSKRVTGFKALLTGLSAMDSMRLSYSCFAISSLGTSRFATMKTALGLTSDSRCSALLLGSF